MPFLETNGAQMHYELSGTASAPILMFSNSLGTNLTMWASQVEGLKARYRILRYDTRGHGQSAVTMGPYKISQLADDVLGLLDRLGIEKIIFCGLSMGGMIGMTLALRVPERIHKVVLCCTAPKLGSAETWNGRIASVQKGGMAAVTDAVLERWYTPPFRATAPEEIQRTKQMLLTTPPDGYIANCEAIRDEDLREKIAGIRVPTLILMGQHDPVVPPADGRFMADRIAGSRYVELRAAHLANIEASDVFTKELAAFLEA
jgi:3-oxoadipate enol-lactonase